MWDRYPRSVDNDWFRRRLFIVAVLVLAAFFALMLRLFFLQIVSGRHYRELSENQSIRIQRIDPPRGRIYDRSGVLLVENRPSFDLGIVLRDAKPIPQTLNRLSELIDVSGFELAKAVRRKAGGGTYRPVILRHDIGRDQAAAVEVNRFDLPGVVLEVNPRRHYLHGNCCAHLIGYLGEIGPKNLQRLKNRGYRSGDPIGKTGVEKVAESFLRGRRGGRQVEVDARGRVVRILSQVSAVPGQNVFLTIDQSLQRHVESLLEEKTGAVVVVDPKTGFILASASKPDFNPNAFIGGLSPDVWAGIVENPWRPMENKVTRGEYPPASTYKIITAAAGLEEGVIDARTTFYCKGFIRYGDRRFRCWKRGGHGKTDVVRALAESCDVYFYHTGMKLGVDRLAKYAEGFGLGKKTGFDVGFEAGGLIPTASWKKRKTGVAWQGGETLSIAIGQSYNLVTPLQMAMLTAAVENGGILLRPQAILRIVDSEGNIVHGAEREVTGRIPVGPETMALIRKGLWQVVNGSKGTARIARLSDIEISGKTGTAQVISRTTAENRREVESVKYLPHAWFIAYAENRGRSIAAAVLVEHGEHGSAAAAPIARDLIRFYFGGPRTVAARTEETERR